MKKNKISIFLYFILSLIALLIIALSLILPEFIHAPKPVNLFYFIAINILLPLSFIFGAISYITSYKKMLLKLVPPIIFIITIFIIEVTFATIVGRGNATGYRTMIAIMFGFLYLVGFLITTSIARFIVSRKKKTKKRKTRRNNN